jgi:hypothetical protein
MKSSGAADMNLLGTKALRWVAVGALITLAGAAAAFSLRTQTIEASGARSAGGPYTLTSAVGQPIVNLSNPSTGGDYTLRSGFLATAIPPTATPSEATGWMLQ